MGIHQCVYVQYKLDDCVHVVLLLMQAFESMFSGMKSKSEALEQENTQLKEAICLPDLQVLFDVCVCVCVHA